MIDEAETGQIDPAFMFVSRVVRGVLEKRFRRRRNLRNLCSLASCAVVRICRELNIEAEVVGGVYRRVPKIDKPEFGNRQHMLINRSPLPAVPHAWLKHRANYIDLTLTQFEPSAARVAVLAVGDARYHGEPEPLEFMELVLPVCGWSHEELEAIVDASLAAIALPADEMDEALGEPQKP